MPVMNPHRFDHLTSAEVIQRIGDLLATAISRQRGRAGQRPIAALPPDLLLAGGLLEQEIVRQLRGRGLMTLWELQDELGVSGSGIGRSLTRLRAAGICELGGRGPGSRYRLRRDFSAN